MGKNSKLGFGLIANSVDETQPLLYRITVALESGAAPRTIYVGQTKNGSKRPFERYDANVRNMVDGKRPLNGKGSAQFTTTCELHTKQGAKYASSLSAT